MKDKPSKHRLKRNVLLSWETMESKAFQELAAADIRVLLRFLQKRSWTKRGRKIEFADGGLSFPYTEAMQALGIGRSTFRRSIRRLHERGFLLVEHQGGGMGQDFSRYALKEDWKQYGTPAFKPRPILQTVRPGCHVRAWQARQAEGSNVSTRNEPPQVQEVVLIGHPQGA